MNKNEPISFKYNINALILLRRGRTLASKKFRRNSMLIKLRIGLADISSLKAHEHIDGDRLKALKNEIWFDGVIKKPIVVDEKTNVIIDGHHRVEALRLIGCRKIPVCYIDYKCPYIGLEPTSKEMKITKDKVLKAALTNNPFEPKSTWHYIKFPKTIKHISCIQKRVDIPLDILK